MDSVNCGLSDPLFPVAEVMKQAVWNKGGHTTLVASPEYRGVATIVHVYHLRILFPILQDHCKQLYVCVCDCLNSWCGVSISMLQYLRTPV
jgi:hypothetical protein